ncbi:MAG: alpha/beta hydrolase-fold protein [Planctomycetota bacterium]
MQRTTALALLAAMSTIAADAAAQRQGGRRNADPSSIKLEALVFAEKTFHSEAVDADVQYGVYLPKDYQDDKNKDTKYPLVIWLHGMFEDHLRFHGRGGAPVLDAAIVDGKLPPCVFVCPNGGRTSMYVNRKEKKYEDLVTVDLLAHLEKEYRLSARREDRAILGVSMGGMAALRVAFQQPELFGAVGVHSAAILPEDPEKLPDRMKAAAAQFGLTEVFGDPIEKGPWEKANPLCIAQTLKPATLKGLHIYFDAGTEDRYGFATGNEALHKVLDEKGIEHTWRLIEGGGHSWGAGFQDQTLPHSFETVGAMFRNAGAKKAGLEGLKDADAKPADAKGETKDETGGKD